MATLIYEPSPKHCEPITAERPGSKCPDWSVGDASAMLKESYRIGKKRFATRSGVAFVAQLTRSTETMEVWHGYPEAWDRIPPSLKDRWRRDGLVTRRDLRRLRSRADIVQAFGGRS